MTSSAYSAESLFGPATAGLALIAHTPFLERAAGAQEESRARIAVAAFALGRLLERWWARTSESAAAVELGAEIAAMRAHLGELPPDDAETAHLAQIAEQLREGAPADVALPAQLLTYALFLEGQGRLPEALDALALATRAHGTAIPPDRFTACALIAGRLNRLLARWRDATTCYEAAECAARAQEDAASALRGRLGRGAVARGQGNLPAARAIAESVQREAGTRQLPEVEAMAYADLAAALSQLGLPVEALNADYRAFQLTRDPAQRIRALGNVGIDLIQLGAYEAARTAFTLVARSNAKALVRVNAFLELMDLESTLGNRTAFERQRRAADDLRDLMPPTMEVDFLFKTASGLARFGQRADARALLAQGLAIAERRSLHAWYFRIEQALREHEQRAEQLPLEAATTSLGESPVVREVAAGLQEYAGFLS